MVPYIQWEISSGAPIQEHCTKYVCVCVCVCVCVQVCDSRLYFRSFKADKLTADVKKKNVFILGVRLKT